MYTRIESSKNEHIKNIKKLYMKKYRDEQGLFLAEGRKLFSEAVLNKAEILTVIINDTLFEEEKELIDKISDKKIIIVPDLVLEQLSEQKNPEGVITVIKKQRADIEEALKETKVALLLDEIKDPGNMGTIIRSADAFGANTIIISPNCVDVFSPKAIRASMGSCFHVHFVLSENIIEDIEKTKKFGFTLIAGDLNGHDNIQSINKSLIAIGSESHGLSQEILKKADVLYKIPMKGKAESLNASVAASIMLYDICNKVYTY